MASTFGVTAGAHRLWSHRAYKAKLPLRIILVICYLSAGMYTVVKWARDHRVHHKYSDTDADPHNASRGFFFSHVGWLMQTKHPEVLRRGKQIDVSDVLADPVVAFQQKYFKSLQLIFWFILPVSVPCLCWGETLFNSSLANITRWVIIINGMWSINSLAHIFGNRPYNRDIHPSENVTVAVWSMGEGWHNYHHTFPLDYKAAELGNYGFNITTALIDMFSYIGWAYDLKQPSKTLVEQAARRTGDGTHPEFGDSHDTKPGNLATATAYKAVMGTTTAAAGDEKGIGTENTNTFTQRIKWLNVFAISLLHLLGLYGSFVGLFVAMPLTAAFKLLVWH
ncbi:hypothetical protein L9F63_005563, partial [Diploptera punctata]